MIKNHLDKKVLKKAVGDQIKYAPKARVIRGVIGNGTNNNAWGCSSFDCAAW